jgi:3-hydroxyanthranilate 3,4-dioxygenase
MLATIDLRRWIDDHRHLLRPPVGNALIWRDADFIVMVVGGPNRRLDFHDDPHEELFHQLEGTMTLRVMEDGAPRDVEIRAGEMLLLPPRVRHSPQRPAGGVGLVVERTRAPGLRDGFEWFCPSCHALLHRVEVQVADIVRDLPPLFDAFHASVERRTCRACGAIHPGK